MKSSTLVLLVVVFAASALCAHGLRCETSFSCTKYTVRYDKKLMTVRWWIFTYSYYVKVSKLVSFTGTCTQTCPALDCVWGAWDNGKWSDCDVKCGNGTITRISTRKQTYPAEHGGKCPGESKKTETRTCVGLECPVDCVWGEWDNGEWSDCDVKCGIGNETRISTRTVTQPEKYGGKKCSGDPTKTENKECDMLDCPETICKKAKKAGRYKHEQDCSKYVQCVQNGQDYGYVVRDCSNGTAWDDSIGDCSSKALEECEGKLCERGALYMHGDDCNRYMKCDHNKLLELTCPQDRPYFASELQTCVSDPSVCNVKIDDNDVLITDSECDKVGESTMDNSSCTGYYVCDTHLRKTSMTCAFPLVFDAQTNKCAETNGRPECKKNKKCTNGEFLADPNDETKYYRCVHGVKVSQSCPGGTVYVQGKYCVTKGSG